MGYLMTFKTEHLKLIEYLTLFTFLYLVTCQEIDSEGGSEDRSLSKVVQSHFTKDSITLKLVEVCQFKMG